MDDLHNDVESLPGVPGSSRKTKSAGSTATPQAAAAASSAELAGLISAWNDLPENIRSVIASLVKAYAMTPTGHGEAQMAAAMNQAGPGLSAQRQREG